MGVNAWWDLGVDSSQNETNHFSFFSKVKLSKWGEKNILKYEFLDFYRIIIYFNFRETSSNWNCKGKVLCKLTFLYYLNFCICNLHSLMLFLFSYIFCKFLFHFLFLIFISFIFFKIKWECVMLIISNIYKSWF